MSVSDTIFALASARGRAGVSVIRLSGTKALAVAEMLSGPLPQARHAYLRQFSHPETGEAIDTGIALRFDGEASFTGEPVVELQTHGSNSVVDTLLSVLGSMDGCRLAEPGEFTRRALINGKMDLVQVEGLADLIEAETEEQRRQANRVMTGELSDKVAGWADKLLKINSLMAASIDFSDEELPADLLSTLRADIQELMTSFDFELQGARSAEIVRDGFVVAIVGKPNVGKSTLLNTLSGREVAITSEVAGTTRDVIEVGLNLGGYEVVLLDTAGLHETDDLVETIGIERARQRSQDANLRIVMIEQADDLDHLDVSLGPKDIIVYGKSDLSSDGDGFRLSAKTGDGIDELVERISLALSDEVGGASSLTRQRHKDNLGRAKDALGEAVSLIDQNDYDIELVSERVREASTHLDQLVGKFNIENVLGEIFSSFCIGK